MRVYPTTDQYFSSHNPFRTQYGGLVKIAAVFQLWKSSIQNLRQKKQQQKKNGLVPKTSPCYFDSTLTSRCDLCQIVTTVWELVTVAT